MPSARINKAGSLSFSWSHNEPYLRGSIIAYPFDWMEASFQYADINNSLYSSVKEFSGSQSLKDKSFDLKFRLLEETNNLPQIAIGFRDFGGTGLFASEYLAASKFLGENIDFTLGLGWGKLSANSFNNPLTDLSESFNFRNSDTGLGGKISLKDFFSGPIGVFAGFEYYIPKFKGVRFKLEYDATDYRKEGPEPVIQDSKFNYGFVIPASNNFKFKLSYTRGNTINFGFSYSLDFSKKRSIISKKNEFKGEEKRAKAIKLVTSRSDNNLYRASLLYLRNNSFNLQKASIEENKLSVVFSQSKYRDPGLVIGRSLRLLDQIAPDKIDHIKISVANGGLGMYSAEIDRDFINKSSDLNTTHFISENIKISPFNNKQNLYKYNPTSRFPKTFISVGPDLVSQIGGPDGFFFGDLKVKATSETLFSRNLSLATSLSYGLINNLDRLKLPSDSVLPHVRTDIVDYLQESKYFSIQRLQFNYFGEIKDSLYYKLSGGILEGMFNGVGGEVLYRPFYGDYGIGFEAWHVFQREYDRMFKVRDYDTLTGHINLYYKHSPSNILFKVKAGRYLAKDSGFTFDFSRDFKSGFRIGAFFSLTDISAEEFGEGSFDKGFYFYVPVDIFSRRYFRRNFGWGLRPLTRDGAQSIIHGLPLWGVTGNADFQYINRYLDEFND